MQINLTLPEGYLLNSLLQFTDGSWRIDLRREDEEWVKFTIYNGVGETAEAALEEAIRRIEGEMEINPHRRNPYQSGFNLLELIKGRREQVTDLFSKPQPTRTR